MSRSVSWKARGSLRTKRLRRCGMAIAGKVSFGIIRGMTKMMKEAIAILHELPEDRQEVIARAILDYASDDANIYHLTEDERREVREGLAEIKRGEIASEREVAAVYKRVGV